LRLNGSEIFFEGFIVLRGDGSEDYPDNEREKGSPSVGALVISISTYQKALPLTNVEGLFGSNESNGTN